MSWPRAEPCACGGLIVALWPATIEASVMRHNESLLHQTWRWLRECRRWPTP